jgi:TRAP-type C4-dicarboxylate transport system substrate-binding protein
VDGHENPLAITEVNRLDEVTTWIGLTNHVWSGFNLIAHLGYWSSLGESEQAAIHACARRHVARQREYATALNRTLQSTLGAKGMKIEPVDPDSFRARLGDAFYARWKERCGTTAWGLLEDAVGKLD